MKAYKALIEKALEENTEYKPNAGIESSSILSFVIPSGKEFFLGVIAVKTGLRKEIKEFAYISKNKKEFIDSFSSGGQTGISFGFGPFKGRPQKFSDNESKTFVKFVK